MTEHLPDTHVYNVIYSHTVLSSKRGKEGDFYNVGKILKFVTKNYVFFQTTETAYKFDLFEISIFLSVFHCFLSVRVCAVCPLTT